MYSIHIIGKGNKIRSIFMEQIIYEAIMDYLPEREKMLNGRENKYLFVSNKTANTGKKMSRQNTNTNIKKYCKRAGIDKDIHNHSLRHTALTTMSEMGMSITKVQAIAGHESVTTTNRYVHTKTEDVEEYMPKLF